MDILEQVDAWCLFEGPNLFQFESRDDTETWLTTKLHLEVDKGMNILFSGNKDRI